MTLKDLLWVSDQESWMGVMWMKMTSFSGVSHFAGVPAGAVLLTSAGAALVRDGGRETQLCVRRLPRT